jgi:putative membrane protein
MAHQLPQPNMSRKNFPPGEDDWSLRHQLPNWAMHVVVKPQTLLPAVLALTTYAVLVIHFLQEHPGIRVSEPNEVLSMSSLAIGLIMGFRTQSSYERWWEGRRLWGELVNRIRNFSVKVCEYVPLNETDKERFGQLLREFSLCLKDHLRDIRYDFDAGGLEPIEPSDHVPLHIAALLHREIEKLLHNNRISETKFWILNDQLSDFLDVVGGCERLKSSPVSAWFRVGIWLWLLFYYLIVPWLLSPHFGYWSIPIVLLAVYFGVALELTIEQLHEPFGRELNDLPLDTITDNIGKSIDQIFGLSTNPRYAKD